MVGAKNISASSGSTRQGALPMKAEMKRSSASRFPRLLREPRSGGAWSGGGTTAAAALQGTLSMVMVTALQACCEDEVGKRLRTVHDPQQALCCGWCPDEMPSRQEGCSVCKVGLGAVYQPHLADHI